MHHQPKTTLSSKYGLILLAVVTLLFVSTDSSAQGPLSVQCNLLQNVSSSGGSDGSAEVIASGGSAPYSYNWSSGSTTSTQSGLSVGTYTVTVTDNNGSTATCSQSIILMNFNPDLVFGACSQLEVILILDESGSIGSSAQDVRDGAIALATGLMNSGAQLAVIEFALSANNTDIDGAGGTYSSGFNLVDSAYVANLTAYLNSSYVPNGCTNWEDAFDKSLILPTADLVVFMTDGNPTAYNSGSSATQCGIFCNVCSAALNQAIPKADILKAEGAHMYGIAVGGSVDLAKISAVTGPDQDLAPGDTMAGDPAFAQADYTAIPFSELQICLSQIANQSCLAALITKRNPACSGQNNGWAYVTAQGGTPPYSYLWNTGSTDTLITNLPSGTYTVTVTDNNGVISTNQVTLIDPVIVSCSITAQTNVTCNGGTNGSATVAGSGGTLPHTFLWSNGNTTATATGLAAGTYTVTVADSAICSSTCTIIITEPAAVVAVCSKTDVTCNGANNGTASVNTSGGTGSHTYLWSNNAVTASINNLSPGTYSVIVTDSSGCSDTCEVTISEPSVLSATCSLQNDASCNGGSDGSASVAANGGTPTYTYLWDAPAGGQTTSTATGLSAGTFVVTITDANGCTDTCSVTVNEPLALSLTCNVDTNVSCINGNDGQATVSASGGSSSYAYIWSDGQLGTTATGLAAGTYTVVVSDANNCVDSCSVTITEPSALSLQCGATMTSCKDGSDGTASVTPNGGTPGYSYMWSNGNTNASADNLSAGTYTVTVTDANGCTNTCSATVAEPSAVQVNCNGNNVSCFNANDGSANASASGGTAPYTYSWSNGGSGTSISNLAPGTYSVAATDANGCIGSCTVTITQPNDLLITIEIIDVSCFGGSDGILVSTLINGTDTSVATFTNLAAGIYTVSGSDSTTGCPFSLTDTINEPSALALNCKVDSNVTCNAFQNGGASVTVSGGTAPYTYMWNNGQTGSSAVGLAAGTYSVVVTDANGCKDSCSVSITEPPLLTANCSGTDASCFNGTDGSVSVTVGGGTPALNCSTVIPSNILIGCWPFSGNAIDQSKNGNNGVVTNATLCYDRFGNDSSAYYFDGTSYITINNSLLSVTPEDYSISCWITVDTNRTNTPVSFAGNVICDRYGGSYAYTYRLFVDPEDTLSFGSHNGAFVTNNLKMPDKLSLNTWIHVVATYSASEDTVRLYHNNTLVASEKNSSIWNTNPTATVIGRFDGPTQGHYYEGKIDDISMYNKMLNQSDINSLYNENLSSYSYLWSNGATTKDISGLGVGTYTVIVTDANGCSTICSSTVGQPTALTGSCTATAALCNGLNGSASVLANGGTPTYSYLWDANAGNQTTATATGLPAGTYSVTITDANNCSTTCSATVTEPNVLSVNCTFTAASCAAAQNGTATANTSGGTLPYSYAWNNGQNTQTATGLSAGTYSVLVTDANGCIDSCSVTVTEPNEIGAQCSGVDPNCKGAVDGSVSVNASGGTAPYTYLWSTSDTGTNVNGLPAGTYTVTVTDNNSCSATCSVTLTDPALLTSQCNSIPVKCNGGNDGSASVTGSGGTAPYTYLWSDGQSTMTANNLSSGPITVLVTDSLGCTDVCSTFVTQPLPLTITCLPTDAVCNGDSTGSISTIASGGVPSFTYLWSDGQTGATATGLPAGNYSVIVTDGNSCADTCSATVGEPTAVSVVCSSTNASCNGIQDGTATVNASGGGGSYTYSWDNGQTSQTSVNLASGIYVVTVSDQYGCTGTCAAIVGQPSTLTANCSMTPLTCFGGNDGTATVTTSGGTPPIGYLWSDGQTTATAVGLSAGSYSVTVTDNNQCSAFCIVNVTQPPQLIADCGATSVSCNGGSDAQISVQPTGGTGAHTYLWSNGSTTGTANNVAAGNYSVIVTDSLGCTDTCHLTVIEPPVLSLSCSSDSVICNGDSTGSATVNVTGGNPPYSYLWSNGMTSQSAANIPAGSLSVVVTDAKGCVDSCSVIVGQPTPLNISCSKTDATCAGFQDGSATASVSGGTAGYTYNWSNGQSVNPALGLGAGTHSVIVTDANGCTITCSVTVGEPSALTGSCTATSASCNGGTDGTATTSAAGGTAPYSYVWSDGQTLQTAVGLVGGQYDVTITDANACSTTCQVTVGQPSTVSTNCTMSPVSCNGGSDGRVDLNPSGGTQPYSYIWSTGDTTEFVTGLPIGSYSGTVTDANGCQAFCTITITEPAALLPSCSIVQDVSFNGAGDGEVTVNVSGGNPPYVYEWSDGQSSATASGLDVGTYSVLVRDVKNCVDSCTIVLQLVDSNPDLDVGSCDQFKVVVVLDESGSIGSDAQEVRDATVALANGLAGTGAQLALVTFESTSINVDVDGGGATYGSGYNVVDTSYVNALTSYLSSNYIPGGCTNWEAAFLDVLALDTADLVIFMTDGSPTAYGNGAPSFCPGGCSFCNQALNNAIPRADAIKARGTHMFGVAVADNINLGNIAAVTGPDQDLAPGDTMPGDIAFAQADFTAIPFSELAVCFAAIANQSCLGCQSIAVSPNCAGDSSGTITAIASGGKAPYTYLWNDGSVDSINSGLTAGTYTVTITDADGVTSSCVDVLVDPTPLSCTTSKTDPLCNGDITGTATAIPTGGTAPYTYLWSNNQTTITATGLAAGNYVVTVTDSLGCTTNCNVTISDPAPLVASCSSIPSSCSTAQNGTAIVNASGGTPPYSYLWNNGMSNDTISGLASGTYKVYVYDAYQCVDSCSVEITSTPSLSITCNASDVSCNGGNDGSVGTSISGGTAPYTYQWNNGQSSAIASALTVGTYTVTVTDANGCTGTCSATVNEPSSLTLSCSVTTNVSCNGGSDGDFTYQANGGTPPYSYSVGNGNPPPAVGGYPAGTYIITVTDSNFCQATCTVTVTEPPALTCMIVDTICTVELDLNAYAHGTKLNTQYSGITISALNNGGKPNVPVVFNSGLIGGTLDPDLEVNIGHLMILPNDTIDANNDELVDLPCDNADGGAMIFQFDNCVNVNSFDFVDQDDNNDSWVWTIDSLGNTIDSIMITNMGNASVQNVIVNSQCVSAMVIYLNSSGAVGNFNLECPITAGQNGNASLDLTAGGGTPGYTYLWSNGATTEDLVGVSAGSYSVTITDANGCTTNCSTSIGIPANRYLSCVAEALSVSACNSGDGEAEVISVIGGVAPYTYSWNTNPVQTGVTATGLYGITYLVTVTDANGTSVIEAVHVAKDSVFGASITTASASCFNGNDAKITVVPHGGSAPYTYLWNDGNVDDDRDDLSRGVHTVTVTDSKGCTKVYQRWVDHAPQLLTSISIDKASCYGGSDGSVDPGAYGGTGPYTYLWSDGGTDGIRNDLSRGAYFVTVTDANGCSTLGFAWVDHPSQVRGGAFISAASCFGSSDGVFNTNIVGGSPPYSYHWSDGVTKSSRNDLSRGVWTVTATDSKGCTVEMSRWVNSPTHITVVEGQKQNATCFGGSNGVLVPWLWGGTAPYTYLWSDGTTVKNRYDLARGTHTLTITDAKGCTKQFARWVDSGQQIWVNASTTPVSTANGNDGSAYAQAGNTVGPYSYVWNTVPPQTTQTATGLSQGFYYVTVTDGIGCLTTKVVNIVYQSGNSRGAINLAGWNASIYPNPASEMFMYLNLSDAVGNTLKVEVTDVLGKVIDQRDLQVDKQNQRFKFDFNDLHNGVYFVRISGADRTKTIRWVVN